MSDVRLIDANELKRDFAELCATECPICSFYIPNADVGDCHCGLIDRAPTITPSSDTEIRWTDKVSLDCDCNIRDFNGNIVSHRKDE